MAFFISLARDDQDCILKSLKVFSQEGFMDFSFAVILCLFRFKTAKIFDSSDDGKSARNEEIDSVAVTCIFYFIFFTKFWDVFK